MRSTPIASGYSPSWVDPIQWSNADSSPAPGQLRQYAWATSFCFLNVGIWYIWVISLINTQFLDGIPQLGTMPSYGNIPPYGYVTERYGLNWALVFMLALNVLLPMTLSYALANNKIDSCRRLHQFFATWLIAANLVVFILLTVLWPFYCNTSASGLETACNSYQYCGVYYPSPYCPNNSPFIPAVSSGDLHRNYEMYMHWIFSLVFFVLSCWNLNQSNMLVVEGLLE